jgi:4-hydroxy-tetrahydrodipicolinate synthase
MKKAEILEQWWGPFPAIVTPFDEAGRIVAEDFRSLVRSYLEDGVRGIIVGGHNGESWALEIDDLEQLVAMAVEEVENTIPILCGIEDRRSEIVVEKAKRAASAGARGIMVEPPYIVTTSTDSEMIDRLVRIADGSPVPIMLYNNPRRTQVGIKPSVLAKLAKHENIVAIKESTRDFGEFSLKVELVRKDINIFVGPATFILPGILYGAAGYVSTGPIELMRKEGRQLYDLAASGKWQEAIPLQFKAGKVYLALFGLGTWPAALKAAMNILDRPAGIPRLPVHPLGPSETDQLANKLREIGILS